MRHFSSMSQRAGRMRRATFESVAVFVRDTGQGFLEISHSSFAMIGLGLVGGLLFLSSRGDVRHELEQHALSWLQARHEARAEPVAVVEEELSEPDAVVRATASDPRELNRQQAAIANWISRRYKVAPEPVSRLVQEAWHVGARAGLDPTLILAIIAVESSFNPFAQSSMGAQGLMQVMTKVHDDKYEAFGGVHAAFDPVTNVRVGVQVLKECIRRAGGLEAGLRFYVGAANLPDDGGYSHKVLSEQNHLRLVGSGRSVPVSVSISPPPVRAIVRPAPPTASADAGDSAPVAEAAPEQVALLQ